jgi:hypothetical protein
LQNKYILYYNIIEMNFIVFLDSRTNSFIIISIPKIIALSNILNTLVLRLLQQVPIKGCDSKKILLLYIILFFIILLIDNIFIISYFLF